MRRFPAPLAFLGAFLAIYFGLHAYVWDRLILGAALSPWLSGIATATLWSLCALPIVFGILPRALGIDGSPALQKIGFFWMGAGFLLSAATGAADLIGLAARLSHLPSLAILGSPRGIAIVGVSIGLGAILLALRGGLGQPRLRTVHLPASGLPEELEGLTVVQLSDVHIGPTLSRRFLARIVERVNALNPDLVAITGDLVDGGVAETAPELEALRALSPRLGVVYVPGNHEYYHGGPPWFAHLRSLGIQVLRNEGLILERDGKSFFVAGVDDPTSRRAGGGGIDLAQALAERPKGMATLLLAHQPLGFAEAVAAGVSLQLSGHTHGGQIFPFNFLVGLRYPFVAGLYQHGPGFLYVSRGTGFWGPPMRLGAASEITHLLLGSG